MDKYNKIAIISDEKALVKFYEELGKILNIKFSPSIHHKLDQSND
jgi:hypothetical protein